MLLDVVLGHGSHDDPAGQLAPVCAELMADGGPQVVAYVLGTEADPQVYSVQRAAPGGRRLPRAGDQRPGGATPPARWRCADRTLAEEAL